MAKVVRIPKNKTKQRLYWLIFRDEVRDGDGRVGTLTTELPDGKEVLPVFSFREEAEMFLFLRDLGYGWRIGEAGPEELLSMLGNTLQNIKLVALDPIPEILGLDLFGLLSLDRQTFMNGLANDGVGAPGHYGSRVGS